MVLPHPSFVMYRAIALAHGASFSAVDLPQLDYDLDAMLAAVREETTLLVICNPNNPTGSHVLGPELHSFLGRVPAHVAVILDEAYGEFVTPEKQVDSVAWLDEFPNLVILRTFSKIFGLAGLRVGYGIARSVGGAGSRQGQAAFQRRLPGPGGRRRVAPPAGTHGGAAADGRGRERTHREAAGRAWGWLTTPARRTSSCAT